MIDNPGYFDFAGQIVQSLRGVVDAGLICLTARAASASVLKRAGSILPRPIFPPCSMSPSWMKEHANFFNVLDSLREMFGASVIPFTFPIMQGETAVGLVDLIEKKSL